MTDAPSPEIAARSVTKPATPPAAKIGLGCLAIALLWWFAYYANYAGPFELLGLKFSCINGASRECMVFRSQIETIVPTYYPVFWYAGMVIGAYGCWQSWKARRADR